MRLALVVALCLALLVPAAASAAKQHAPGTCMRIANQLVHFDAMKQRAAELENEMWVQRFEAHLTRLEGDFAEKCPAQAAEQQSLQQLAALLKTAGRAALTFFTLGAY
jgi:hypothetical protein